MKKILSLAGSNHSASINFQLIEFVGSIISKEEVTLLDIRDWDIPMYSIDKDPDQTPKEIVKLISLIGDHDGFIISSPEHNGGTPAFFKNIIDWLSRRKKKVFDSKPVLLLSTSPGQKGGATNLDKLIHTVPYQGANIVSFYSLPFFNENFKEGKVIGSHLDELKKNIEIFIEALHAT